MITKYLAAVGTLAVLAIAQGCAAPDQDATSGEAALETTKASATPCERVLLDWEGLPADKLDESAKKVLSRFDRSRSNRHDGYAAPRSYKLRQECTNATGQSPVEGLQYSGDACVFDMINAADEPKTGVVYMVQVPFDGKGAFGVGKSFSPARASIIGVGTTFTERNSAKEATHTAVITGSVLEVKKVVDERSFDPSGSFDLTFQCKDVEAK